MEWIELHFQLPNGKGMIHLPKVVGKYIVETKTSMNNRNRFETNFDGEKFSCKNQIVLRWLKED
jgi:hypothetical protein